MQSLVLVAAIVLSAAPGASRGEGAADIAPSNRLPQFVADILAVANVEAAKHGIDPESERVHISVSNRLSKADRVILEERLGVSETDLWVVCYAKETDPPSVGGYFSVYFREGSADIVGLWHWD